MVAKLSLFIFFNRGATLSQRAGASHCGFFQMNKRIKRPDYTGGDRSKENISSGCPAATIFKDAVSALLGPQVIRSKMDCCRT